MLLISFKKKNVIQFHITKRYFFDMFNFRKLMVFHCSGKEMEIKKKGAGVRLLNFKERNIIIFDFIFVTPSFINGWEWQMMKSGQNISEKKKEIFEWFMSCVRFQNSEMISFVFFSVVTNAFFMSLLPTKLFVTEIEMKEKIIKKHYTQRRECYMKRKYCLECVIAYIIWWDSPAEGQ